MAVPSIKHHSIAKTKRFTKWTPYIGHAIEDEQGILVTSVSEGAKRWKRFFELLMAGYGTIPSVNSNACGAVGKGVSDGE